MNEFTGERARDTTERNLIHILQYVWFSDAFNDAVCEDIDFAYEETDEECVCRKWNKLKRVAYSIIVQTSSSNIEEDDLFDMLNDSMKLCLQLETMCVCVLFDNTTSVDLSSLISDNAERILNKKLTLFYFRHACNNDVYFVRLRTLRSIRKIFETTRANSRCIDRISISVSDCDMKSQHLEES